MNFLCRLERSTDQVMRALYTDALFSWANTTWPPAGAQVDPAGQQVLLRADSLETAPLLRSLGYAGVLSLEPPSFASPPSGTPSRLPDYSLLSSDLLHRIEQMFATAQHLQPI